MTETEARARLERLTAPDMEPLLDTEDIDDLLELAKRPDTDGYVPSDAEWTPTWDIDSAACAAWEVKAGRAAAGYRFSEDGQSFSRDQVHQQCLNMAKLYRRGHGSVSTTTVDNLISRALPLGGI